MEKPYLNCDTTRSPKPEAQERLGFCTALGTPMNGSNRVEYFVHGRGRGHGSRAEAVARALRATRLSLRLHAGADALESLGNKLGEAERLLRTPLRAGPASPLLLGRRTARDVQRFSGERPRLVVSDGDQAAILAARIVSVPTLVVGHDLVFNGQVALPDLPRRALWYQRLNALPTWAGSRFVAVHFLPAKSRDARWVVARPDELPGAGSVSEDGRLLCYFRDANAGDVAAYLAASGYRVVWYGGTHASPGVDVVPFSREAFRSALSTCSGVVSSAGSNLLAECVTLHKPMLALYRPGDAEQQLNATLADAAGVAVGCSMTQAIPHGVRQFLQRLRGGNFERINLRLALPPLSSVVEEAARALLGQSAYPPLESTQAVRSSNSIEAV